MGTLEKQVARQRPLKSRRAGRMGVDLIDAKKALSKPQHRTARLIESVLREAGSAEGPEDLSSNLRHYLT